MKEPNRGQDRELFGQPETEVSDTPQRVAPRLEVTDEQTLAADCHDEGRKLKRHEDEEGGADGFHDRIAGLASEEVVGKERGQPRGDVPKDEEG